MASSQSSCNILAWIQPSSLGYKPAFSSAFCCKSEARKIFRNSNVSLCKMTSSDNSAAGVDDYAQFSEMLGMDSGIHAKDSSNTREIKSPKADISAEKYAEFADMLGTEQTNANSAPESTKPVEKAKPKKTEIDPADYAIFDSLLQHTGGTGRKPMKGSKRYMNKSPRLETSSKSTSLDFAAGSSPEIVNVDANSDPENSPYLTEEETAQAYAVMMEEFGTGIHGNVPMPAEGVDIEDLSVDIPELQSPPQRPSDIPVHDEKVQMKYSNIESIQVPPAQEMSAPPLEPPPLQKPPTRESDMPVHDEKVKMKYSNIESIQVPPAQDTSKPSELQKPPMRPSDLPVHDERVRSKYGSDRSELHAKAPASKPTDVISSSDESTILRKEAVPVAHEETREELPILFSKPSVQAEMIAKDRTTVTELESISREGSVESEMEPENTLSVNSPILIEPPQRASRSEAAVRPSIHLQTRREREHPSFPDLPVMILQNPKQLRMIEL